MASIFKKNEEALAAYGPAPAPAPQLPNSNTPNLDLQKPVVGGDIDTWGQMLNDNWDKIDEKVTAFPSGTRLLFQQTSAPTGWTKDTTQDDKALRIVSGTAGVGGSMAFTSAFAARSASGGSDTVAQGGTVNGHAITIAEMPVHNHSVTAAESDANNANSQGWVTPANGQHHRAVRSTDRNPSYYVNESTGMENMSYTGGGAAHSHSFSPNSHNHAVSVSFDMAVAYVDAIIAVRD